MPTGTHSDIYTPGSGFQHTGHDHITAPRQAASTKNSRSQRGLLQYIQRCDEVQVFASMAQPLARIHSCPLHILVQGDLQDSKHSFKPQPKPIQILSAEGSHHICLQGGLWWPNEQPILQGQVAMEIGQEYTHQHLGLKRVWMV